MSGFRGVWVAMSVCLACGGGGGGGEAGSDTEAGESPGTAASAASEAETSQGGEQSASAAETSQGGELCDGEVHTGEATYYAADGSGNCSFDPAPGDLMVAAMNNVDYAGSAACGACVAIEGPDGTITVRIVDSCPECPQGDIDLSEGAFPMIAAKELGRVPISWRYVACPTTGPIVYHFKEGSNEWWTAVQIRGHKNPIASFEYKDAAGQWQSVPRLDYNYFVAEQGMGPGPYSFRVTDTSGNALEDTGIPFVEAGDAPGAGQFPACG